MSKLQERWTDFQVWWAFRLLFVRQLIYLSRWVCKYGPHRLWWFLTGVDEAKPGDKIIVTIHDGGRRGGNSWLTDHLSKERYESGAYAAYEARVWARKQDR